MGVRLIKYGSHKADVAFVRSLAERKSWINAKIKRQFGYRTWPDLVMRKPDGSQVAVEVERVVKSKSHYAVKLVHLLDGVKQRQWDLVLYLAPDERRRKRIEAAYRRVKRVNIGSGWRPADLSALVFDTYMGHWQ